MDLCILQVDRDDIVKNKKTNAARILDSLHIDYSIMEYEVDLEDLSAIHVAANSGQDIKTVFKTLVCRGDKNGVLMAWLLFQAISGWSWYL